MAIFSPGRPSDWPAPAVDCFHIVRAGRILASAWELPSCRVTVGADHDSRSDSSGVSNRHASWTHLHDRVIAGDPAALETIAGRALPYLRRRLRRAFPRLGEDVVHDAVVDALMDYFLRPQPFDSASCEPVDHYLYRAAWRNADNALTAQRRRRDREERYAKANRPIASQPAAEVTAIGTEITARVLEGAIDDAERTAIECWFDGERRTASLARALGVSDRPMTERKREVKRFKDRLRKRFDRLIGRSGRPR
jgi:hypothetical protein